jgi:transposase
MPRTKRKVMPPDTLWEIPDSLWPALEDILNDFYPPARTGRPRADFRVVLNGIIYRLRSGVQWNKLPEEFGSDSTVHRWFQQFAEDGVFQHLWAVLVDACDELGGVSWAWQAADGVMGKARFGGTSSARTRRTAASPAPSGAC